MSEPGQPGVTVEVVQAVGALFGVADAVRKFADLGGGGASAGNVLADRLIELAEQLGDNEGVDPALSAIHRRAYATRTEDYLSRAVRRHPY